MSVDRVDLYRYRLPLTETIDLRGHKLNEREGLILRIQTEDGAIGLGEIAPLPGFSDESIVEMQSLCCSWMRPLKYSDLPIKPIDIAGGVAVWNALPPSFQFGISCAAGTLKADMRRDEHFGLFPMPSAETVRLNALIMGDVDEIRYAAEAAIQLGYADYKLKVGRGPIEDDVERVYALRETVGGDCNIVLDANRAWQFEDAEHFAREVRDARIIYIEEPLRYWKLCFPLRLYARTAYAVDETLQEFRSILYSRGEPQEGEGEEQQHLRQMLKRASAHVIKPTLTAGLRHISTFARECSMAWGARPVISAAYESGLGLVLLGNLAATLPDAETPAGLDTYRWLAEDVLPGPLPIEDGCLDLVEANRLTHAIDFSQLQLVATE